MSVIHEALKKTGQSTQIRQVISRKKKSINWGPFFVMGVLVVIVSPIIAPLFRSPYRNEALSAPKTVQAAESDLKTQFAVEEAPLPVPPPIPAPPPAPVAPPQPNFWLNGLVYSGSNSYCLINGKVVREGQRIDGATLVKVTPDEAVLDYEGRQIVLSENT